MAENVRILAIDIYFPSACIYQEALEAHDGGSKHFKPPSSHTLFTHEGLHYAKDHNYIRDSREGESSELGYEKGRQDHVQLAKALDAVSSLSLSIKMDDLTVQWSKERYDEMESKAVPFLKQLNTM
ncbi:hypothetical protein VNO77_19885 [Canavalia gladiata]|uniref:Uncharacterized protein n=1 Tax=Canavalia gladiata TaxID=3824 RepID=A0AAN9QIW3_CANGL